MKWLVLTSLAVCAAAGSAVPELFSERRERRAVEELQKLGSAAEAAVTFADPQQALRVIEGLTRVATTAYAAGEASRLARALAERTNNPDASRVLLCGSLALLENSIKGQPFDSRRLVRWAGLRQVLGSFNCPSAAFVASTSEVSRFAAELDRGDPRLATVAAQIALWDGDRDLALDLAGKVARYAPDFEQAASSVVLAAVRTDADLARIVPDQLPHVARWSRIFREKDRRGFFDYKNTWAAKQLAALERLADLGPEIHDELRRQWLFELSDVAADDRVRARTDAQLGALLMTLDSRESGEYLRARSQREIVSVLPAWLPEDFRPLKNPLFAWKYQGVVALDVRFGTIGFAVGQGARVGIIEVYSRGQFPSREELSRLELYSSEDNLEWYSVDTVREPLLLPTLDGAAVVLFPRAGGRFWKVHYPAAAGRGSIRAEAREMLKVYSDRTR